MNSLLSFRILRALRDHPEGLTLDELARAVPSSSDDGASSSTARFMGSSASAGVVVSAAYKAAIRPLLDAKLVEVAVPGAVKTAFMFLGNEELGTTRYRARAHLAHVLALFDISLSGIAENGTSAGPSREHQAERRAVVQLREQVSAAVPDGGVRDDLLLTLGEIASCLESRAYLACMALVGRATEVVLRDALARAGVEPTKDAPGLRSLITDVKKAGLLLENERALIAQLDMIDGFRNPAVHARARVPSPSGDQAAIVVRSLCDLTRRLLLAA